MSRTALPLDGHCRLQDDGNRKAYQQQIRDDVGRAHGDELSMTLPTIGTRIGDHLPIVREGLTFRQGGNDDANKRDHEEPTDALQTHLIRPFPHLLGEAFEKFRDGEFGNP